MRSSLLCVGLAFAAIGCSSADNRSVEPSLPITQHVDVIVRTNQVLATERPLELEEPTRTLIRDFADNSTDGNSADNSMTIERRATVASSLPAAVADAMNRELAERAALNDAGSRGVGGARFASADAFAALVTDDEVIGYVVTIEDIVDHPGWHGSGVHLFYDLDAAVVASNEWTGSES